MKTIKVGMMPGKINEFVVEVGTTIESVLEMAGLDYNGFTIKVDGVEATPDAVIDNYTSLILLVKQVKGNTDGVVKVGMMPGRINEFVVEAGATIQSVLEMAELDSTGYDVKVDGVIVKDLNEKVTNSTSLILLAKQVKGN